MHVPNSVACQVVELEISEPSLAGSAAVKMLCYTALAATITHGVPRLFLACGLTHHTAYF
jgi:hypothetical protein